MEVRGKLHAPAALSLKKETPVLLDKNLVGPKGRHECSRDEKNVPDIGNVCKLLPD
jgi:hypothetical protein